MTMLSFRVDDQEAADAEEWARSLGIDRSELLRTALAKHLAALRGADDAAAWERLPLTEDERALGDIAEWGPAEDWSDWADAAR